MISNFMHNYSLRSIREICVIKLLNETPPNGNFAKQFTNYGDNNSPIHVRNIIINFYFFLRDKL